MAKFSFSSIFLIIFGVTTLIVLCNSATVSSSRGRKVIVKKKKIVVTTTPPTTTTEPPPEDPITFPEPDSSEDSNGSQESSLREKETFPGSSSPEGQVGTSGTASATATSRNTMRGPRILNNCDECIPEDCETPPATSCPIGLEQKEALCECGTKTTICGTDNKTYQSECKLHEAAHLNSNLTVKNWHACYSAPSIPASVENVTVAAGDDVSLSCEVRAFPPPVIHWQFQPEDSNTRLVLPGDDSSVVVTIRGGPEQIMTTSWIQFVSVTPKRQGVYFCLAKNEEGMTQSSAIVSVYKNQY